MVAGVSSGGHVGVVAITALRYAQSDGPDVVMPVRPAETIFASFRHIRVRPDFRLEEGVPLYKLKILDALIEHLSRTETPDEGAARSGGIGPEGAGAGRAGMTAAHIDQAIESLSERLRQSTAGGALYQAGLLPEPGAFLDMVA